MLNLWLWLSACEPAADAAAAKDSRPPSTEDSTTTEPSDTPPVETGTPDTAMAWTELNHLQGGAVDGAWSGGRLGTLFRTLRTGVDACTVLGSWVDTGEPTPPCPSCDWSFTLTVVETTLEGHCAALELQGAREGRWDGFSAPWGFGTEWFDDAYGITWDRVLLIYYGENWFLWAYETGYDDGFDGDATSFTSETELDVYYRE